MDSKSLGPLESLEHPTLKVPYEVFYQKYRDTQKKIDRDVLSAQNVLTKFEQELASDVGMVNISNIQSLLGETIQTLKAVKKNGDDGIKDEEQAILVCKKRIEHLKEFSSISMPDLEYRRRIRLHRMLVDYFLRCGYYNSAKKLVKESALTDLTNIDLFMVLNEIEQSLASHETTKCLKWCHDNQSKLHKQNSTLEFNLRTQEFIEILRQNNHTDAMTYACKYLSTFEDTHEHEVNQYMALLHRPIDIEISPYKEMFDEKRWQSLMEQFRKEYYNLYQLNLQSPFTVALQIGLSALKTPQCYSEHEDRSPSCPVCQEWFNTLASQLPFGSCEGYVSTLQCSITGILMDDDKNRPMMLPNGQVYGELGLQKLAEQNNGRVLCPKTYEWFPLNAAKRVFVLT